VRASSLKSSSKKQERVGFPGFSEKVYENPLFD